MRRWVWVLALVLLAPEVRADKKATAEALYEQGKAMLRDGNYAEACAKFAASHEVDPSMGALLHLADCQEKRQQLASAWATWREAIAFSARTQDNRRKIAEDKAKSLEARLPRIVFAAQNQPPGLQVRHNGEPVSLASFGVPLPVNPGEQKVEAVAPKKKAYLGIFTVQEGQTLTVQIPALQDEESGAATPGPSSSAASSPGLPPTSSAPVAPATTPAPAASPEGLNRRTIGLALGAVGVVGVGVGTYFGLQARSKWQDSRPRCEGSRCDHEGALLAQDAQSSGNLSTISFALGAAALGAGAYLFLFSRSDSSAVQVSAAAAPSGGFLSLKGSY